MDDGVRRDGSRKVGRTAVDEDVDVRSQPRSGLDQPIAQPGHGVVQAFEEGGDGLTVDIVATLRTREQRQERAWKQDGGHGPALRPWAQASRMTASTAQISGSVSVIIRQLSPASRLCQS